LNILFLPLLAQSLHDSIERRTDGRLALTKQFGHAPVGQACPKLQGNQLLMFLE
jgi:hypothetical protein